MEYDYTGVKEGDTFAAKVYRETTDKNGQVKKERIDGDFLGREYRSYGVLKNGEVLANIRFLAELRGVEDIIENKNSIVMNIQDAVENSVKGIPSLEGVLSYNPKDYNPYVEQLQRRLNDLNYTDGQGNKLEPDGRFGKCTLAAVNKYKEQNQLWNNGIYAGKVGNTTWLHLFENEIKTSIEDVSIARDIVSGNSSKEFISPINDGRITSLYGPREKDGFHEGVDIAVAEGTPVYAVSDGELYIGVNKGNPTTGYGYYLMIKFGKNSENWAIYGHLKDELPEELLNEFRGQYPDIEKKSGVFETYRGERISIKKGQIIGYVSHSGICRPVGANHLHFTLVLPNADDKRDQGDWGEKYSVDPITRVDFNLPLKETVVEEYKRRYEKAVEKESDNIQNTVQAPVSNGGTGNTYVTKERIQELFNRHGHSQKGNVTDDLVRKMNETIEKYVVDGCTDNDKVKLRIQHFLTQCLHESKTSLTELYNGDPNVWFKNVGGGAKYRGAGFIQLTHKSNYQGLANAMNDQKIVNEGYSYVAKNYAWEAAGFWWKDNGMNQLVDGGNTLKQISNAVNRGPGKKNSSFNPNGWEDRLNAWKLVQEVIK